MKFKHEILQPREPEETIDVFLDWFGIIVNFSVILFVAIFCR